MGMEALETVISYWEDALQAYQPANGGHNNYLTTAEEAKFMRLLENILEGAFQLQVSPYKRCTFLFLLRK